MSTQLKTMAMKARVYNKIRTFLYKKQLDKITDKEKIEFFDEIYKENIITHWELINYKRKRQDKKELLQIRLAAPQTKTMQKKLSRKKVSLEDYKKSLENSK